MDQSLRVLVEQVAVTLLRISIDNVVNILEAGNADEVRLRLDEAELIPVAGGDDAGVLVGA